MDDLLSEYKINILKKIIEFFSISPYIISVCCGIYLITRNNIEVGIILIISGLSLPILFIILFLCVVVPLSYMIIRENKIKEQREASSATLPEVPETSIV